ncbi:MAG: RNA methyltransferase [Candidatus Marinimicrobia bacterium]|nr:RNA methyltransferase [Candidatus Neomarinimicrobiota bacterium]
MNTVIEKNITKKEQQFINSLKTLHGRKKNNAFIIEGIKNVEELLLSELKVRNLYLSSSLSVVKLQYFIKMCLEKNLDHTVTTSQDYQKITTMNNPEGVLAICEYCREKELSEIKLPALYLSEVNDPGNLGTIFRTAAWFGVPAVIISENSVDAFNPKVVRSSMGSFFHLTIIQNMTPERLINFCDDKKIPLFIADLNGENPVNFNPQSEYILCFGSESHGVPQRIMNHTRQILSIPKYGRGESLNLAMSVGIMLNSLINKGQK